MKPLWPTVNPTSPAIARLARRYEMKLRRVLDLAARRESRRDPALAALYKSATVQGVDLKLRMKKAVITFSEPPFRGGLHEIFDWATIDTWSDRDLASSLAWSLRASLSGARRRQRGT